MWSRVNGMFVSKFKKSEDGAILVFFGVSVAAIFLVAALTFDLGRRASTQTEMQSFTDHVALAAAGELNGFEDAIPRAINAANQLIEDTYVIGDGDRVLNADDFHIYFYEVLPDDDESPLGAELDQGNRDNDALARFVRVAMINDTEGRFDDPERRISVPWVFARLLRFFGDTALPTEFVSAESVAGYTSLACDVAPVFFCMPEPVDGVAWDPGNNIGQTIRLRDGDGGGGEGGPYWEPGNFTWLDIREQVPDSVVDDDGPCGGLSGNNLYECLFAAEGGVTLCFENGTLTTLPGQKEGNVAAVFDTRFDIYRSSSSQVADDPDYKPAPVVTKAYTPSGVCSGSQTATNTTMALPPDDCFKTPADCATWSGEERYGDTDWSQGRLQYVDQNYSLDPDTVGSHNTDYAALKRDDVGNLLDADDNIITVDALDGSLSADPVLNGGDIVQIEDYDGVVREYHKDDPFRPEFTAATGLFDELDAANENLVDALVDALEKPSRYTDFPVVPGPSSDALAGNFNGATKWSYYQAEVAASLYSNPKDVFNPGGVPDELVETDLLDENGDPVIGDNGQIVQVTTIVEGDRISTYNDATAGTPRVGGPLELIESIPNATGPGFAYTREGGSRPYCSTNGYEPNNTNYSTDPRRRTLVAAAVDCNAQKINGKTDDVRATYFVEVFLISPSDDDPLDKKKKEIFIEIISPALNTGEFVQRPGRFRNLVQLYRHKTLTQ